MTIAGKGTSNARIATNAAAAIAQSAGFLSAREPIRYAAIDDDGGDGGLDPVEYRRDHGLLAEGHVDPRQHDQDEERRQNEQAAGDDAAPGSVHEPADVGRELLRLWAGQHHAVVERVQKTAFGDPAPFFHELLMHDRDLSGRTAEADESELEPEQKRVAEAHSGCGGGRRRGRLHGKAAARGGSAPEWREDSRTASPVRHGAGSGLMESIGFGQGVCFTRTAS